MPKDITLLEEISDQELGQVNGGGYCGGGCGGYGYGFGFWGGSFS